MVAGVESGVDSSGVDSSGAGIHVHMLGPMRISRGGVPHSMPPSRNMRALISYQALAPNVVMRSPQF